MKWVPAASVLALALAGQCVAQPALEQAVVLAAKNAIRLCGEAGAGGFEDCVNLGGRGPKFTAARLSSVDLSKARMHFMNACTDLLPNCVTDFNFLILQALRETASEE